MGGEDPTDFLSASAAQRVVSVDPALHGRQHHDGDGSGARMNFATAPDGRFVVKEEEGEEDGSIRQGKRRKIQESGTRKPPEKNQTTSTKGATWSSDRSRSLSALKDRREQMKKNEGRNGRQAKHSAAAYKSKKAGGDHKKK